MILVLVAYNGKYNLWRMCPGAPDKLWVAEYNEERTFELNCSSRKFTETGRILDASMEYCQMCYLPPPDDCLAVTGSSSIKAVSCKTGSVMWEMRGEVDGGFISPRDMLQAVSGFACS